MATAYGALAGSHQLWRIDPDSGPACPYAGTGGELIRGRAARVGPARPAERYNGLLESALFRGQRDELRPVCRGSRDRNDSRYGRVRLRRRGRRGGRGSAPASDRNRGRRSGTLHRRLVQLGAFGPERWLPDDMSRRHEESPGAGWRSRRANGEYSGRKGLWHVSTSRSRARDFGLSKIGRRRFWTSQRLDWEL